VIKTAKGYPNVIMFLTVNAVSRVTHTLHFWINVMLNRVLAVLMIVVALPVLLVLGVMWEMNQADCRECNPDSSGDLSPN
jgi:hypothetical protein